MKAIRVSTDDFEVKLKEELSNTDSNVFVLFFGAEAPETGESWCPDCVIADPAIRAAILKIPNSVLIEASVGLRDEWKGNKQHPYRVKYNVQAIPTLYTWTSDGPGKSLVENDCADHDKLSAFLAKAPAPALDFNITAEQLEKITEEIIAEELAANDEVASLTPEQQTYENIVVRLARVENNLAGKAQLVVSWLQISPEKSVRDASEKATKKYEEFSIQQSMRHDLYTVIQGYIDRTDLNSLAPEDARMLRKIARDFRRCGLHLADAERTKLTELRKSMSQISTEYMSNWSSESSTIDFTKEELEGMDDDFLSGLKVNEDGDFKKYILTMKYTDVRPVMKLCKNEETRKKYYTAFESRNRENIELLEETIKLRRECAKILGYDTHAAYVLEVKMAKEVRIVSKFLEDLKTKLRDAGLKDIEELKTVKKTEREARGELFDGEINAWDTSFYENILLESKYDVNHEEIKKYFSLKNTIKKMLDIYGEVLGLQFVKVPEDKASVWHKDVQLYECWDNVEDKSFSGYMFLDLFPRDSKYPHAACFPLQPSYIDENGERVAPIAAMVANFTKPTADKPSLLKHDEVVTLFHELGHVMHHLCSRTKYARFHGTSVEGDFVEAPSQMLENWCFNPASLKRLSAHYETGEPISDEKIDRLVKAKNALAALMNLRQLFFGIFDLQIHTSDDENLDTTKVYNDLRKDVSLVSAPNGSCGQAAFAHIMGGYDAGYYGYMWSKVYSSDMFYSKFQSDPMSPETGLAYRKKILERGSSKDGMDLLIDFLGREPSSEAFMREDIGSH